VRAVDVLARARHHDRGLLGQLVPGFDGGERHAAVAQLPDDVVVHLEVRGRDHYHAPFVRPPTR